MEEYQPTEVIKEEVVDCGFVEVDSQDVHQLCTACLCATRTTHTLNDGALKQYYMHILTEMQPKGSVVLQSPRVCWECVSHLKRSVRFREQVQDSYRLLQPMLSMCDQEDLDEFLQTSVCRPGRLKTYLAHSINISPQDDAVQVMTVTGHDGNNDDEAALGSLENGFDRHTFQENDASIVEEPSEAFCDEKYDVCVSEDVVESPPMCKYNIENYIDHDRSKEQLDKTNAHLRKEVLNRRVEKKNIININTPIFTHVSTMSRNSNTTFICDYCYKTFTSNVALERHIATYNIYPHNNKTVPSPCKDCAVVLCSDEQCSECPNKHNLLQHNNMRAKTAERHFLNNECDKSFSVEADLPRDNKVHPGEKPFQCEMCHKSFAMNYDLIRHKRIHTGERPYQCQVCHKSFTRKGDLSRHKRIHTGEKPFPCEVCHKSFTRKGHLTTHKRLHSGVKLFQCKVCNKSFVNISKMNRHKRIHTGEKPFQCEVCRKSFTQIGHLSAHKRIHTGEKSFQCEVCSKSFTSVSNLNKHKRIHTGEKPFQCKVCHKSFAQKGDLIMHFRTHTGEKSFQCVVCHKSFTQKGNLTTHNRLHSGEKPYQCAECHKYFAQKGDLIKHFRTHTGEKPYQCEMCHKSFAMNGDLIRHKRIHTGERPYQCQVCYKSFTRKEHLTRHKRLHSGEKPYQCAECHKSYTSKHALIYHIRSHTTDVRRSTSV